MVVPDAPPLPKDFASPTVHAPKRAAPKFEQSLDSPSKKTAEYKAEYKVEEPITVGPKRLPDSPFPKRLSPTPFCTDQVLHIER